MRNHGLWQRQLCGHQESRPIDAVEADDLLADHVHVCGPVMLKFLLLVFFLRAQANGGTVVAERIKPNVHHVLWIAGNWNAPLKSAAADGEIAQPALDESDDLIAPRLRTDEAGVLLIVRQQLVGKGGELEVIVLFAYGFRRTAALWARRAGTNRIDIKFVEDTILAGIRTLINEAFFLDALPQLLRAALVAGFRGADVVIVGDAHLVKQCAEFGGNLVHPLLWRRLRFTGGALNLYAMLVSAG